MWYMKPELQCEECKKLLAEAEDRQNSPELRRMILEQWRKPCSDPQCCNKG